MIGEETINKLNFIENESEFNNEKYLKDLLKSGITTIMKSTKDKELEIKLKKFSSY